ncbi:MAG: hypothetical protein ACR2NL_05655, partial [Acidimicrobiia bacterium]
MSETNLIRALQGIKAHVEKHGKNADSDIILKACQGALNKEVDEALAEESNVAELSMARRSALRQLSGLERENTLCEFTHDLVDQHQQCPICMNFPKGQP